MTENLGSLDSLAGMSLHQVLENTGLGLIACDAAGRMTLLSPMLQDMFDLRYAPLGEGQLPEVFSLFQLDGVTAMASEEMPIARARAGEYVRDEVVIAQDRTGRRVYLECNAAPLQDDAGQPAGAVVLAQDVTARYEAEQVIEELRRRLVETVNHEFRTPVTALVGNLEVIHEHHRDDLPPELARSLAAIERAGWRLRDLVCEVAGLIERQDELYRAGRTPDGAPRSTGPDH